FAGVCSAFLMRAAADGFGVIFWEPVRPVRPVRNLFAIARGGIGAEGLTDLTPQPPSQPEEHRHLRPRGKGAIRLRARVRAAMRLVRWPRGYWRPVWLQHKELFVLLSS